MASFSEHMAKVFAQGGRHEIIVGTLKDVRAGNAAATGKPYRMATVAFEGGKEMYNFDPTDAADKLAYETLPPEGTRVAAVSQVDSERDRKGALQVFRRAPQFFQVPRQREGIPTGEAAAHGTDAGSPPSFLGRTKAG